MTAAEGGAAVVTPLPDSASGPAAVHTGSRQGPTFPRALPAFEVETVTVKSGDDRSLSAWVQLEALGYHTVGVVPGDGGVVLYLERSAGMFGPVALQLPAELERDPKAADALRTTIKSLQEARQKAMAVLAIPMPAPAPVAPLLAVPATK